MKKKKCYIYTRVSTAAQIEGYSLEAQKEKLEQYADYKDLVIAGEYCDAGKSGHSIKGRPAFMAMMDDISSEKDNISYVLVFKLSRFGRNAADVLKSMQLLSDYDVDLVSVEDAIDSSTQGGKLTLSILSAVAEIERENINVQFSAGRMQKIMDGGWPGGPAPYGYRCKDKQLVLVDEEAVVVKKIYELYLQDDLKLYAVVRWLNENGYTKTVKGVEKPFTTDSVKTILSNPVYCGKIMYNRRTNLKGDRVKPKEEICVIGKHTPIVSEEQWEAAQKKREELSIWGEKKEDLDRVSLLSGLVKCPVCGGGMVHMKNKSVNHNKGGYYKTLHYYACRNYRKAAGRTCSFKHTYNQEKVDQAVLEIVSQVVTMPRFEKEIEKAFGKRASRDDLEQELKDYRKQLHSQEHLKYKLGERLDALDILSEDYDAEYDRIQEQIDDTYDTIEDIEHKISRCKKQIGSLEKSEQSIESIKKMMKDFPLLYEEMDCFEKRDLYRQFIDRIEMYPEEQEGGKILKSITFRFAAYFGEENFFNVSEEKSVESKEEDAVYFTIDCSELGPTVAEAKATYAEIKAFVLEKSGLKVSSLYIAQIKRKYGIDVGEAYNKPADLSKHVPVCPKTKELAIMDALKAFRMLDEKIEYKEAAE